MKNAITNTVAAVIIAALAYGVGATEGKDVKEKATNAGLKAYMKLKELWNKVLPKQEGAAEPAPEAPEE